MTRPATPAPPCRALLFDLDGTLVDSSRDIAEALRAALVETGRAAPAFESILPMIGDGSRVLVERALGRPAGPGGAPAAELDPAEVERTLGIFLLRYAECPCRHTRLLPGALEALAIGPNGLVTNKPRPLTILVLEELALVDRFGAVFAGGDGPLKPAPDGIRATAAALGVAPHETWFVGDGPQDIVAGRRAGCFTIAVPGIADVEHVRAAGPDLLVGSLFDVVRLARARATLTSA